MKFSRREILERWWLLPVTAAGAFFLWFGKRSYNILLAKPGVVAAAKFIEGPKQRVASTKELSKVGATKEFIYSRNIGSENTTTPAVVVRTKTPQLGGLNMGGAHYIALSKICTHLYCESKIIRSPEIASLAYKYRPDGNQPIIGCDCHFSAFDPEIAGKSVSGPALKPLPRLRLTEKNGELFVTGIEASG